MDVRLKYLMDLSQHGDAEARTNASNMMDVLEHYSTTQGNPSLKSRKPLENLSNKGMGPFELLVKWAVAPYITFPAPLLHGVDECCNTMRIALNYDSNEGRTINHPFPNLGPVEVEGIEELYRNLCRVEDVKSRVYRHCPSCSQLVKRVNGLDDVSCGVIDADHAGHEFSQFPVNGCGVRFNWSHGVPYQKRFGMEVTEAEQDLHSMKRRFFEPW